MTTAMTEPTATAKMNDGHLRLAAAQKAAAERVREALLAEVPPTARKLCGRITKLLDGLGATGAALAKLRQELEGGIIAATRNRDDLRGSLVELQRQRRDLAIERQAPETKIAREHAAAIYRTEQRLQAASDVVRRLNDLHADLAGLARQLGVAKAVSKSASELV